MSIYSRFDFSELIFVIINVKGELCEKEICENKCRIINKINSKLHYFFTFEIEIVQLLCKVRGKQVAPLELE